MKMSGKELIEKICQKLREENILLYDSAIKQKIESLTANELSELVNLGDVSSWIRDRTTIRKESE